MLVASIRRTVQTVVGTVSPSVVWRTRLDKRKNFVRSGAISEDRSSARRLGFNGYGWSATATPNTTSAGATGLASLYLNLDASSVDPSDGTNYRWNGFPIRCLVY